MRQLSIRRALAGAVTLLAGASIAVAIAIPAAATSATTGGSASHAVRTPGRVYVAPNGRASAHDVSCGSAAYSSVQSAVSAARPGGTVVVCAGTYHEDVTVSKALSLSGDGRPVIDATGKINGFLIKAPHVRISGFTITGAIGEGILVDSVNYATISHNVIADNDQGGLPKNPVPNSYPECQTQDGVPGDCGEGIHLMGSSFSTVADNIDTNNTGGILLSDETGPTSHNRITGNVVADNLSDCGITVAGHNPDAAPKAVPAPKTAGVYANLISGNTVAGNGTTGQGAGVLLATGVPGGAVYDNIVERNTISGNGISGVTVHSHVPGEFLNGNIVRDNVITVNNLDGDNDFAPHVDDQTTGVLVATVDRLTIEVTGNEIAGDHFGIWTTGPVTVGHANDNFFAGDAVPVAQG
jgi:parallel beta-helix repeat protein